MVMFSGSCWESCFVWPGLSLSSKRTYPQTGKMGTVGEIAPSGERQKVSMGTEDIGIRTVQLFRLPCSL